MKKETSSQQPTETNVEDSQNKGYYSKEVHQIENSPYTAVKIDEMYNIALADQIVTNRKFETIEEAKNYVDSKPYDILFNGIATYMEKLIEIKKQLKDE